MKLFNKFSLVFWIIMVPVATVTGWINSNSFISYLSLFALIWTAWVAVQSDRTPLDVVNEIVAKTEVNRLEVEVDEEVNIEIHTDDEDK